MEIGMKHIEKMTVSESDTARAAGSGTLSVFSTPSMVALMEKASYSCVQTSLDDGLSTVGTKLTVEHLSATPVGMTVKAESELVEIDGRRLVFKIEAKDETGVIGRGTHERFIIKCDSFVKKTYSKLDK